MNSALITLQKITKKFGYRTVLNDISFEIEKGNFILLLGNNGAGKTTLLRIISSLMRPSHGKILYKNKDYRQVASTFRRALGNISHESRLYSDLTALENLKLFGTLYQVDHLSNAIHHALATVELEYASHLPVRTFSSGMTKRLAIARLLLYKPEFLILDEPYTGLDYHSVQLFQNYLKQYHQKNGTVLMVTHQFSLGLELANRIIVIRQNQLYKDCPAVQTTSEQCSLWLQH